MISFTPANFVKSLTFFSCRAGVILLFCLPLNTFAQSGVFMTSDEFHRQAFGNQEPQQGTLWLDAEQKEVVKTILGHRYSRLRVRYTSLQNRSAWVLEEVGKDLPITFGVVVENQKIVSINVLEFRESRGGDIRHDFFTRQFHGLTLDQSQGQNQTKFRLDGNIDGITGATLSVRASKKIATLALFLHGQVFDHTPSLKTAS